MATAQAFEALIAQYGAALKRLCRGYEADAKRREELEQDVLLGLWQAIDSFRGEGTEKAFVFRVAHNTALKHVRWNASRPIEATLDRVPAAPPTNSDAAMDRKRQRDRLYGHIQRLKPPEQELILLHLEGLTNPEIAGITGLSATNVSTKLSRIRTRLQKALGGPHGR